MLEAGQHVHDLVGVVQIDVERVAGDPLAARRDPFVSELRIQLEVECGGRVPGAQ